MSTGSAYDPETVELLRTVLDEAWNALQPQHKEQISKSHMAECVRQKACPFRPASVNIAGEGKHEALIEAARGNRYGHRDSTMILLTYRHGLRAAEVCDLRWDQVDFHVAVLHVRRVKNGTPSTHPIQGDELRALRRL
jgi:integrase